MAAIPEGGTMNLTEIRHALTDAGPAIHLFPEARDPKRWETLRTHPYHQKQWREVCAEAQKTLTQPLTALPYSAFKLFRETGSRREYEQAYFARRSRLNALALLALAGGGPAYLSALEDTLWAICDEATWCLPAHLPELRDASPSAAAGLLATTVDLFAAETGMALAEILSLLDGKLAAAVRNRIRLLVGQRILQPFQDLGNSFWWETAPMNWAAVCAGSIGMAAIYLEPDSERLALILDRVLAALDRFLDGFGADGACPEGIGYWGYGFGYFVYCAELLRQRSAGQIDLLESAKVKQIALFQQRCYLTGNSVVSFSDAAPHTNFLPGLTGLLQRRLPEVIQPAPEYRAAWHDDAAYRWAHAIRNLVWDEPASRSGLTTDSQTYLPDAQWLIIKGRAAGRQLGFAAKGGHNDEPHNHNDLGSFLLQVDGENLLTDLGSGLYTRQYFGAERYQYLVNGSQGHSVPIIEGGYQPAGREFAAASPFVRWGETIDRFQLELGGAYRSANLTSLIRSFELVKAPPYRLQLTDNYQFKQIPDVVIERFVTLFPPQRLADGKIGIAGKTGRLDLAGSGCSAQVQIGQEQFLAHDGSAQTAYLIDFVLRPEQCCFKFILNVEIKNVQEHP